MTTTTPTVLPAATPSKALTFPQMLEKWKPQIARALPKHLSADRMIRIALTEFRKNKDLAECDPQSIFAAIIIAAQLGLEPGIMGQAYLVPYKSKRGYICTFIPGWQGYVDLVSRSGRASVWTEVVRGGDSFTYNLGTKPEINHQRGETADGDGRFTYTYAVGWVKDSQWPVLDVWTRRQVEQHLGQYNKVGDRHYALQNEHNLEMYGRKVALLQVIKYMPKSVELQTATNLDYAADAGNQVIEVAEALTGTFIPSGYPEEEKTMSPLAGLPDIPQLAEIQKCAKQLGWNDAQIANELGRVGNDGAKLLAQMKERVAEFATTRTPAAATSPPVAETSPVPGNAPTSASEAAVAPPAPQQTQTSQPQQPPAKPQPQKPRQRNLTDPKDF